MKEDKRYYGGLGFLDALTIALVVLKLCKVISWSWALVLLPIWGQIALAILIYAIVLVKMYFTEKHGE